MSTELKRSKYRLLGLVGQGQFGKVFCAVHRKTGRLFALKSLDHQRFPTHKFLRELRFLLSLQHEHIVTCYALEHNRTGRYLVLDYCEGGTLRGLMESEQSLTFQQSFELIMDVLAGLGHAHDRGIVHCDIKPENIMLTLQPEGWTAKISDFGIARLSQELSQEAGNTGSPAYMAPERFYGQYSHASDLYAVGVMLYELLVGDRPFTGSPMELMSAHMNQTLKVPDDLPETLRQILITSLQKLPARRFRSAREMEQAIAAALEDPAVIAVLKNKSVYHFDDEVRVPLPLSPFQSCQTQTLRQPITTLQTLQPAPSSSANLLVYQAVGQDSRHQLVRVELDADLQFFPSDSVPVIEPIEHLFLNQHSSCAVAHRALYSWVNHTSNPFQLQLLAHFAEDTLTTVHLQKHWAATAFPDTTQSGGSIKLWQVNWQPDPEGQQLLPRGVATSRYLQPSSHILTVDRDHGVIISDIQPSPPRKATTVIEVFTRRGHIMGGWKLPILLRQVINSSSAYRLMALEEQDPYVLLVLDLKPYRLQRIPLEIAPVCFTAMPWGYVLADAQGQLLCLDDLGRVVGHIDHPPETVASGEQRVTAIAPIANYGLLLATWNAVQQTGFLHSLDLRTLNMDLVF